MWIPSSAEDLLARVGAGDLEESASFDGKRELGASNSAIAVDICAMTAAGGVLIYGIAENDDGTRLTEPWPLELSGARERLSQIAATSIAEPPLLQISALEAPNKPGQGFIVVTVPPSPRAPHQVIVRGKHQGRFYGRDATGNRILTESEVANLYARRDRLAVEAGLDLDAVLRDYSSVAFGSTAQRVYMLAGARPLTADNALTIRAGGAQGAAGVPEQLRLAVAAGQGVQAGAQFAPNLQHLAVGWERVDADNWTAASERDSHVQLEIRVGRDGTATLYSRRAGDEVGGKVVVFEEAIAGLTAGFLRTLGILYERAGYIGVVECGVLVRPLAGLSSHRMQMNGQPRPYGSEVFQRSVYALAGRMRDEPEAVAMEIVGDLLAALVADGYTPFQSK